MNLDAVLARDNGHAEDKKLPHRIFIAQALFHELGIEKSDQNPSQLIYEMQVMRDYLYLVLNKSQFFHSYGDREFCCLDDPKGREIGSFVIETPKKESLKAYIDKDLKGCEPLQKLYLAYFLMTKNLCRHSFRKSSGPRPLRKSKQKKPCLPHFLLLQHF